MFACCLLHAGLLFGLLFNSEDMSVHFQLQLFSLFHVAFEVLPAVAMKNTIFWDITPCSEVHQRFGETYCLHLQSRKVDLSQA
jgi:hypothetical protein